MFLYVYQVNSCGFWKLKFAITFSAKHIMAPLQSFGPPVWMREVDDGDYLLNQGGDDNFEDSLGISIADFLMWLIEVSSRIFDDNWVTNNL